MNIVINEPVIIFKNQDRNQVKIWFKNTSRNQQKIYLFLTINYFGEG